VVDRTAGAHEVIGFALTLLVALAFVLAVALGLLLGYTTGLRMTQNTDNNRVRRPAHSVHRRTLHP
jgi:hypothetical protein